MHLSSLVPTTAAMSSNLGNVNSLRDATRVFDMTRDDWPP